MQRVEWDIAEYSVSVIEDPSGDGPVSQDASLVTVLDSGFVPTLRLAAIDGVTPTPKTPVVSGVDGAVHAAAIVRSALLAPVAATACLEAANAWLQHTYAGGALSARDVPQAAVAVTDLAKDTDGTFSVEAVCSGDAEVWICTDGNWESLFPGDMLAPGVRAAILAWKAEHSDATREETQGMELELLPREAWFRSALGRFAIPKLEFAIRRGG
jgi:hypothetical protein